MPPIQTLLTYTPSCRALLEAKAQSPDLPRLYRNYSFPCLCMHLLLSQRKLIDGLSDASLSQVVVRIQSRKTSRGYNTFVVFVYCVWPQAKFHHIEVSMEESTAVFPSKHGFVKRSWHSRFQIVVRLEAFFLGVVGRDQSIVEHVVL